MFIIAGLSKPFKHIAREPVKKRRLLFRNGKTRAILGYENVRKGGCGSMEIPSQDQLKNIIAEAFSITEDTASKREIKNRLQSAGKVTGTNLCMMVCANLIACIGLNAGSMTVVVGAMLIEPLLGSILMLAYSTAAADRHLLKAYGLGFAFQIAASILASTVYFLLTPLKEPTAELISMTRPALYEVVVALVGGIAGMIGMTRKEKVNTIIPGVAIATSLMPPLCTCGYAISAWNLNMLAGAAYLFLVNAYFIALGASLILSLFKIPRAEEMTDEEWEKAKKKMIRNTVIFIIPALIATILRVAGKV